uniref:Uncharacterized protein n=1 Tax=Plectus sambesii TaxID=2011161 RepID=A0A914W9F4_9BILA
MMRSAAIAAIVVVFVIAASDAGLIVRAKRGGYPTPGSYNGGGSGYGRPAGYVPHGGQLKPCPCRGSWRSDSGGFGAPEAGQQPSAETTSVAPDGMGGAPPTPALPSLPSSS